MNIAVIGANGRLGKVFVTEALRAGHHVTAGIRELNGMMPQANLEVAVCDATKLEDVRRLLRGQDVVVSAIGHVKGSAPDVQTVATRVLVSIMNELHIRRYVDVTGTGVRFPNDSISLIDRLLNYAVLHIDRNRVVDGITHQEILKASSLDWTTIRVLKLQEVQIKPYELRSNGPTKLLVGRREVASAMLQVIEEDSFIKQAPILSPKK